MQLLYSLEYDRDPVSTIQTLLLLSLRSSPSSRHQGPSHWISLAVQLARREGIHSHATGSRFSISDIGIRKRIWTCCVMQDALTAMAGCRAPSISFNESRACSLQMEDFDFTPCGEASGLRNIRGELDGRLAEVFIQMAKLSSLLNCVLWAQNEATGLMDRTHCIELSTQLEQWRQGLPSSSQPPDPAAMLLNDKPSPVDVQRIVLHMTYHISFFMLHRENRGCNTASYASTTASGLPFTTKQLQSAHSVMRLAAVLVTCKLEELVPVAGAVPLLPALIAHTLDAAVRSTHYKTAQDAQQSIQLLEHMKEKFDFAEMAACHLGSLRAATHVQPGEDSGTSWPAGDAQLTPETTKMTTPMLSLIASPPNLLADFTSIADLNDSSPESLDFGPSGLDFLLPDNPNFTSWLDSACETAYTEDSKQEHGFDALPRHHALFLEDNGSEMLFQNVV